MITDAQVQRLDRQAAYLASLGPGYWQPEPGDTPFCVESVQSRSGPVWCQLNPGHDGDHEHYEGGVVTRWGPWGTDVHEICASGRAS